MCPFPAFHDPGDVQTGIDFRPRNSHGQCGRRHPAVLAGHPQANVQQRRERSGPDLLVDSVDPSLP